MSRGRAAKSSDDLDMRAFRAAQVVRKRMRTKRREVEDAAFLSEPSRELGRLQDAGIVATHNPDPKAWRKLSPGSKASPGRPNMWLTLAPDLGYLIGVAIAHGRVSASITKADFGKVVEVAQRVSMAGLDEDPEKAFDVAAELIVKVFEQARDRCGAEHEQVIGIGIGLPAPVSRETKTVSPEMQILSAWSRYSPADEVAERLGGVLPEVSIEVDNDASLGALGVHCWEALTSDPATVPRDLVYVGVGDGIGAGVVIKGKLVGGGSGFAGEIGHVKVDDRGRFCPRCGQRGCVETKSSDDAVLAELRPTVFADVAGEVAIEDVIARGHPACLRALHEAGWHLGAALAHARTLLDPTRMYVGGPMSRSERFMQGIREGIVSNSLTLAEQVHELVVPSPRSLAEMRPDLTSPELLGAVAIALHRCGDSYIERKLRDFQAQKTPAKNGAEDVGSSG